MSLQVFSGSMFSGKSKAMMDSICKFIDVDKNTKALIINHALDTRDSTHTISSHSSMYKGLNDAIDVQSTTKLESVDVSNYTKLIFLTIRMI